MPINIGADGCGLADARIILGARGGGFNIRIRFHNAIVFAVEREIDALGIRRQFTQSRFCGGGFIILDNVGDVCSEADQLVDGFFQRHRRKTTVQTRRRAGRRRGFRRRDRGDFGSRREAFNFDNIRRGTA